MPAFHVARSILINAPILQVRESLIDYRQWPIWSPWLIMEPATVLQYSDTQSQVGAGYNWKGELTGEGAMELKSITDNRLDMHLQFITPFKSTAEVAFDLEEEGNATKVTWNMDSSLPFFLFWMVNKMKAFIGMDYDRGLKMLKDYLEIGSVPSKIKIDGLTNMKSQRYIGIANQCNLEDMATVMPEDFKQLYQFLKDNNLSQERIAFSIYNTFNIFKNHTSFISAIPVDDAEDMEISKPFITGELEGGDALKVTHTGRYEHLGNAWSTAINYSSNKKIKTKKTPIGVELYLNNPMDTAPEDLIAEVMLPLK